MPGYHNLGRPVQKRDFLMSPQIYHPKKCTVGGYYISEKLGGVHIFWDGGISRTVPGTVVPWANVTDLKTGRIKPSARKPVSGMWSESANPIMAPDRFLNLLPCMPLEGVLWAGRGEGGLCQIVCQAGPEHRGWDQIEFAIFSSPPVDKMFSDGVIKNNQMFLTLQGVDLDKWLQACNPSMVSDWYRLITGDTEITFDNELAVLRDTVPSEGRIYLLQQKLLPMSVKDAAVAVEKELARVRNLGGLGVVMRDPYSCWEPKRSPSLLEYSPTL